MNINQLLDITITRRASDLHLLVGDPPTIRVDGILTPIQGMDILIEQDLEALLSPLLVQNQKNIFSEEWELDFGFEFQKKARFRANIYRQKGTIAAAFRLIPVQIRNLDQLGLPPVVSKIVDLEQGLILVTGPTGHGKSTTLASFINQINMTRDAHIITIEDPIEYIYPKGKSLISQRELNADTKSWSKALKSVLREDPDIVLLGEMRDLETISAAMTIAETGHLVFSTLHTNSASQTIDRIIDVFPYDQQSQIRTQLAAVIEAIISQRLVPTITPGRALAHEVLFGNPALRNLIRESKTHQIDNLIQTSAEYGMVTMENSLALLVREGKITSQTAMNYASKPELLRRLLAI
jgi:twitching motility protein PilT